MERYSKETEAKMKLFYTGLEEKNRRHYAALEASKLGHGGKQYIGKMFKISQKTLRKGERELLNSELYGQIPLGKQRRIGGGRKKN